MKLRTKSPIIEGLQLPSGEEEKIKEPLKFTSEELDRLTITLMGYPFISFGNALLCPRCGVQQGVLTNRAPDGEVNFYLNFRCECYKKMEEEKIAQLGELVSPDTSADVTASSQQ
jgi:hypothetical protein